MQRIIIITAVLTAWFCTHVKSAQYQPINRVMYDGPTPYSTANSGYPPARPVLYAWFPWMVPSNQQGMRPTSYESNNPLVNFFQNPVFPWSNRQPSQSTPPLQSGGIWGPVNLLPWSNNHVSEQQRPPSSNPVASFFQNPAGSLFPWNQQTSRPGLVYETPLPPSPAVGSSIQPTGSLPGNPSPTSATLDSLEPQKLTPEEAASLVVEDTLMHQIPQRRVTVHQLPLAGVHCS